MILIHRGRTLLPGDAARVPLIYKPWLLAYHFRFLVPRDQIARKLIMLEGVIDTGLQEDVELLLHSEGKCMLETQLIHWNFLMLPCIIVAENCQEKHS